MSTSRYQSEFENRKLPPRTCRAGEQTINVMGPGEIKGGSVQSSGFHRAVAAGKKKKQIDVNHTQMGIGHGHTPAEQDEGEQRDGKRRIEEKDHADATAVAGQLCMRYASKGLLAAGNPVSTPAFQTIYADWLRHATLPPDGRAPVTAVGGPGPLARPMQQPPEARCAPALGPHVGAPRLCAL
jgi:hypothetical protein